jgi:DNA repair protein RadA/Sms
MKRPTDSIPNAEQSRQNSLDEPPWSPELLDLIAQRQQVWLCHDQEDADLLLRPDAGDFPALRLPLHQMTLLTRELCQPLTTISVIQRSDESLDDGFYARYGLQVKRQLEAIGWRGTLYRVPLNQIIPTLPRLWSLVREDGQKFQQELVFLRESGPRDEIRGKPRGKQAKAKGPRPIIHKMEEIQPQLVQWLWWPYLPLGKVVMVDGDPGLGKSLLMVELAASLSRGHRLPDQQGKPTLNLGEPASTLIISTEDGLADTLRPRLDRAKADVTRVRVLNSWHGREDEEHAFTLQDLGIFEQAVQEVSPRLVILDPLHEFIGAIDLYRANETRPLLTKVSALAERYGFCLACIRHPSKSVDGGKSIHRGIGGVDLIAKARSGLFIEAHPTDPDKRSLLMHNKSNIGVIGRTQVFSRYQGEFSWCGVSRLPTQLVAGGGRGPERHALIECCAWLEDKLTPGIPKAATEMEKAAEELGHGIATLKRAKRLMGVDSVRQGDTWWWMLPRLEEIKPPF